ncbi:ParB/RepB/Spo0J family partition protein [Halarcobacter anaerophilus]|uniref:ParB-like N-terminal domain-containing protein n=1 Tax=Halarcobacter anaerophilus TaxID=877500 RepID=A0A4Q0Y0V5_9BACT|nr:ParB/RepB/Spo0J family partition protein [Halarcobacter anaerophilus]QDF28967.1 ParB-like nuclease domain-containing protein [Halarcobacter anaerophilus]RXJ63602.1 hypothetical protein CRV06_05260 [Halarcobacter anaerophilus]
MSKKDFEGFNDILVDGEIVKDLVSDSSSCIDISLVKRNPHQPRFYENEEEVEELMESIKGAYEDLLQTNYFDESKIKPEDGLLQPIIVSPCDDGTFICVGGHRRLKACKRLGHKTIKANIVKLDESQLVTFSIVENLQRKNLSDFETALAIDKAIASGAFDSESKLAETLGKKPSFISKCKNVLKLPTVILDDLHQDRTNIGLEILNDLQRLQNSVTQEDLYFKYKAGEIKGADIRAAIKEEKNKYDCKEPYTISDKNIKFNFTWNHLSKEQQKRFQEKLSKLIEQYEDIPEIEYIDSSNKSNVYIKYKKDAVFVTCKEAVDIINKSKQKIIELGSKLNPEDNCNLIESLPNRSLYEEDDQKFLKLNEDI